MITEVNASYIFTRDADGKQDRRKSTKLDLTEIYNDAIENMNFYSRMSNEILAIYENKKEVFDRTKHYYTEEEIDEAKKKRDLSYVNLEISNENYTKEINKIFGLYDGKIYADDKFYHYYKLAKQCENALKHF